MRSPTITGEGIPAPLVTFSATEIGRMGAQALLNKGHKRVAFFGPTRGGMTPGYLQGFREALREAGVKLPERMVCVDDTPTFSTAHEAFVRNALSNS